MKPRDAFLASITGVLLAGVIIAVSAKEPEWQEAPRPEPTGCPYGDSIPMDICYAKFGTPEEKAQPPQPAAPPVNKQKDCRL